MTYLDGEITLRQIIIGYFGLLVVIFIYARLRAWWVQRIANTAGDNSELDEIEDIKSKMAAFRKDLADAKAGRQKIEAQLNSIAQFNGLSSDLENNEGNSTESRKIVLLPDSRQVQSVISEIYSMNTILELSDSLSEMKKCLDIILQNIDRLASWRINSAHLKDADIMNIVLVKFKFNEMVLRSSSEQFESYKNTIKRPIGEDVLDEVTSKLFQHLNDASAMLKSEVHNHEIIYSEISELTHAVENLYSDTSVRYKTTSRLYKQ